VLVLQNKPLPTLSFCHVSIKTERPLPKAYPSELKKVGDHIRKKRLELKLLQKEVARILGVSKDTITYWEVGRSSPRLQYMPKIVEFLGYVPFEKEPETLGEKIVYYRWLKGMTQKELSRQLGIDPSTLACWECGNRKPNGACRERLISFLDSLALSPAQEMSREQRMG
jgi:DNA-binding transcriptional regulator YiaG